MKKHVLTFVAFFVMCMASLAMVSCSDDDDKDDSQVDKSALVGKWVLTNLIEEDESGTDTDSFEVSEEADVILLNEDGSCRNYCEVLMNGKIEYDWDDKGSWILSDNTTLKLLFYGEGQQTVKVLKMTDTTLSFECSITDDEYSYKYTATYQKVK